MARFDVFLSFRGSDTRQNFTSHLYAALQRKHIHSFIDDKDLDRGTEISTLWKAIHESKISVIVFSQKYASSRWCLDELVKILECTETTGHKAIPIFYKVNPSDVSDLTGNFGKAFRKLTKQFCNSENGVKTGLSALKIKRVKKWLSALEKATNLSGWDSSNYRNEAELIGDIVEDIFQRLYPNPYTTSNELVAIDSHIKKILPTLSMGSGDVRFVGLWGMGGIGKTTIAEILYSQISCQFDRCHFFRSVREEAHKHGLTHLRNKFFCHLLGMQNMNMEMLHAVPTHVRDSLGRLKIIVVLDDVSDPKQLKAFGIGDGWFGPGSRIILTSRDKQVFNNVDDIYVYEVPGLDEINAFELLSVKAFKQKNPPQDYMELSKRVLHYAQGLPLALTVLGSHLRKRPPQDWELELNKLNQFPDLGIQEILEISFEGLDDAMKPIFLDLCCLEGYEIERISAILDGCGFPTEWGINRLKEKCLISRDKWDRLQLHDLVKEMGQEMARRVGRLYNNKDIIHISTTNARNETVEAIVLSMVQVGKKQFNFEALSLMPKLRLLNINGDPQMNDESYSPPCLSGNLRLLHWTHYPFKSLPSKFFMDNLVELRMPKSKAIQLWEGNQCLPNLKLLNLRDSAHLMRLPDLSSATKIEKIYLSKCISLEMLPPCFGTFTNLKTLAMTYCRNLRSIPSLILATSLHYFSLKGCLNVKILPEIPSTVKYIGCSESGVEEWVQNEALPASLDAPGIRRCLASINLSKTAIREVPSSIRRFSLALGALNMRECEHLLILPESICELKCLQELRLDGCSKLSKLPPLNGLNSLKELSLEDSGIAEIPTDIVSLPSLTILIINKCKRLQSLPLLPRKLHTLQAKDCTMLQVASISSVRYFSYKCNYSLSYRSHYYDFRNCIKLSNNAHRKIMANVCCRVEELATLQNVVTRLKMILPGREIPEWFKNQSEGNTIVVKLPHVTDPSYLTFAFCAAVEFDHHATDALIGVCCDCLSSSSARPIRSFDCYSSDLNKSDHVLLWYISRPFIEDVFLGKDASFQFKPACDNMEKVRIRRCGIQWIVRKHK